MGVLKGFHQNVVAEDSRKHLRIICHLGVYEYQRMPFGIKNAPSHFQRMMDMEFHKLLLEKWLIIYIDDIISCSNTWKEHVERLSQVLDIVIKMGMKISLKKCKFGFNELKALGHIVSGLTIAVDQGHVAEILLKPIFTNSKELQSILGFMGYYRNHMKDYAIVAAPLSRCGWY